jgi:hypothetical protein
MKKQLISVTVAASLLTACGGAPKTTAKAEKFDYTVEQFADLQILRYRVPEFENLSLKQKELVYYLTEAALQGRDILFDQNGKYNLRIRRMLEAVYTGYTGDKTAADFKAMEVYLKRVWFSNGASFLTNYLFTYEISGDNINIEITYSDDGNKLKGQKKVWECLFSKDILKIKNGSEDGTYKRVE